MKTVVLLFGIVLTCAASHVTFISGYDSNITAWNLEEGKLSYIASSDGQVYPSWLAWNSEQSFLYAVNEIDDGKGEVHSFAIHHETATLTFLNSQPSGGGLPCFIHVHASIRWVFVTNYRDGYISIFPIKENGQLGPTIYTQKHGEMAHMMITDRSTKHVFVPFKGSDLIAQFNFNAETGTLTPNAVPFVQTAKGAGPRHITFHPTEKWAYVVTELASTVITYAYNGAGVLTQLQVVSALPSNFTGTSTGAEILVSKDGAFVYASNRGHDSIAIFRVLETGVLETVGWAPAGGPIPRGVSFDIEGDHLIVAHQDGNTVTTFKVDKETGLLAPLTTIAVPTGPSFIGVLP